MEKKDARKSPFVLARGIGMSLALGALLLVGGLMVARGVPGVAVAHAAGGGGSGCATTGGPVCIVDHTTVQVGFSLTSPDGCVHTNGSLEATETVTHNPPTPRVSVKSVQFSFFQQNSCTGALLTQFDGVANGVNFQGAEDLNAASLNGTFTETNLSSGATITLTVHLTWQGVGAVQGAEQNAHTQTPDGTIINTHFESASRAADVSGSLSFGSVNIVSGGGNGVFEGGEFLSDQTVTVTIPHP